MQSNKVYVGVDNGVTGSLTFLHPDGVVQYYSMPVKRCLNYTKVKSYINRIDVVELEGIFCKEVTDSKNVIVGLERPMINPGRFPATISAVRAFEATLVVIERLMMPYCYLDSKGWQRSGLLPKGLKTEELKKASAEVASRLFPSLKQHFKKDGDSALIAEYLRREDLRPLKTL